MYLLVRSKKSKTGTFHFLWVNCSIFALTHFSPTRPIPHLTIQNTLPIKSATSNIELISGRIFGILGAGGSTGNLRSIFGINDGNSGNCGGQGSTGMLGTCISLNIPILNLANIFTISRFASIVGGSGKLGNSGNGILMGTKLNLGNTISRPTST